MTGEHFFILITIGLIIFVPIFTFIFKKNFCHLFVDLNRSLFTEGKEKNISRNKVFIAEWLLDTGIIYTIFLIIGLLSLWLKTLPSLL